VTNLLCYSSKSDVTSGPHCERLVLAQNARDLYYASGFEREDQEAVFLSYREVVESIHVPVGREAGWREFSGWFARMRRGHELKEGDGTRYQRRKAYGAVSRSLCALILPDSGPDPGPEPCQN
jgi:hypothetical protein